MSGHSGCHPGPASLPRLSINLMPTSMGQLLGSPVEKLAMLLGSFWSATEFTCHNCGCDEKEWEGEVWTYGKWVVHTGRHTLPHDSGMFISAACACSIFQQWWLYRTVNVCFHKLFNIPSEQLISSFLLHNDPSDSGWWYSCTSHAL